MQAWQDHGRVVVKAGTSEQILLSVRPGFSLQWQFCLDGIAADVGFHVKVLDEQDVQQERSDDSTEAVGQRRGLHRRTGVWRRG